MAEQKLGGENPFLQYVTPATGDLGLTIEEENPFLQYVEPIAEYNPFLQYVSAPEPEDTGFFSELGKGFQGFEFGTVAPKIGLQADSGIVAKSRQYLGAYTQLEQGATAEDIAAASEGALNLEQLQRYQEGTEEERQKLREFSEITGGQATTRTLDRLGTLAESEARTQEFAPAVPGVTDVKSLADFRDWLGYSIGSGAKQILPIMGAAAVAGVPGALAVGVPLAAGETISNRLSFIQDVVKDLSPEEQAIAIAEYLEKTGDTTTIVALTSGALDLAGPVGSILKRRLTKDLSKEVVDRVEDLGGEIVERTATDVLKGAPKEFLKDALEEGATGAAQEATQIAGKRATGEQVGDLLSDENIKSVIDSAAAEAAGGIAGSGINVATDAGRQLVEKKKKEIITRVLANQAKAADFTELTEQELMEFGSRIDQYIREGKSEEEAVKLAGQDSITGDVGAIEGASAQAEEEVAGAPESLAPGESVEIDETVDLPQEEKEGILDMARNDAQNKTEYDEEMSQNQMIIFETLGPNAAALFESTARALIDAKKPSVAEPALGEISQEELEDGKPAPALDSIDQKLETKALQEEEQVSLDLGPEVNTVKSKAVKGRSGRGRPPTIKTTEQIAQAAANTKLSKERTDRIAKARKKAATSINPVKLTTLLKKFGFETIEEYEAFDPRPQAAPEVVATEVVEDEAGLSRLERIERAVPKEETLETDELTPKQKQELKQRNAKVRKHNALTEELKKYQTKRIEALTGLYEVLNDPQYRGNGVALNNIKKFIAREDISPDERELAKQRAESKGTTKRSDVIPESTNSETRPEYAGATQPASLFDAIMENGSPFEKLLARRLKPFLANTQLVIVNDIATDIPDSAIQQDFYGASGIYDSVSNTVFLNNTTQDAMESGLNNTVFLHEAVHAATVGIMQAYVENPDSLSPKAQEAVRQIYDLMGAAQGVYTKRKEAGLTSRALDALADGEQGLDVFNDLYEFVAYGITKPEFQEFLTFVEPTFSWKVSTVRNGLGKFFDAVRKLFNIPDNQFNGFLSLVDITDTLLDESKGFQNPNPTVVAQAKKQVRRASAAAAKLAKSSREEAMVDGLSELAAATRNSTDAVNLLKSVKDAISIPALRKLLYTFTTDGINRIYASSVKNLTNIDNGVMDMAIYRGRRLRDLADKLPEWDSFNQAFEKGAIILADVMHLATLHNFDPAAHKNLAMALKNDSQLNLLRRKERQIAANPLFNKFVKNSARAKVTTRENHIREVYEGATIDGDVYAGWNNLQKEENGGQKGVKIYKMARDSYRETLEEHQRILQRKVARSGLPDEAKRVILAAITQNFQEAKKLEVYFPLMRYGDHWLRVGKGKTREFYMFESAVARNAFARKRANERRQTYDEALSSGDIQVGDNRRTNEFEKEANDASGTLKTVFELLDENPGGNTSTIKDSVYQMYLMTLSGQDMRRRFVHRKGVAGFSPDVLRNFVTSQHTSANQLARLEYSETIRNYIAAAYAEIEGNPDAARLEVAIDEIAARALDETKPGKQDSPLDKFASAGNKVVFYWLLSAPKSAIIQFTQLPIVGLPVLSAEFGVDASIIASRYMATLAVNKFGTSEFDADGVLKTRFSEPSMSKSSYVLDNPDKELSRALQEAHAYANDREFFMQSYAADLTSRSQQSFKTRQGLPDRVVKGVASFMSGGFHHMERINREIMFMSAFELAYADAKSRGLTGKKAQQEAQERAYRLSLNGLFNYSNYNKPRIMKSTPAGRLATQFMTFPMQMTSYLTRNFFNMLNFYKTSEERKQAATQFFGTMGMTFMFAGAVGLPGYTLFWSTIEAIREMARPDGEDDDPWYDEDENNNPLGYRDLDLWFRETFLPKYFGADSSLAKALGLSEEQAAVLQRGMELGPISALTGFDFAGSTSLNGLWFRDDVKKDNYEEALTNWLYNTATGPFGSLGRNAARGAEDLEKGNYKRAMEAFLPAMFRNPVKALRLYEEGYKTRQGAPVRPQEYYTKTKIAGQILGFGDTEVSETLASNFLALQLKNDLEMQKTELLDDLNRAVMNYEVSLSDEAYSAIMKISDKIDKHNLRNPGVFISSDTIEKSLEGKAERRGAAFDGLNMSKGLEPYIGPLLDRYRNP